MTYATQQNLVDRFGLVELVQLTDLENTGSLNATRLGAALADASATIDGYLAGRYPLPLTTVPNILVIYCGDIARYMLYDARATEQVTKRYDDAIKFLALVSQDKISLGMDSGGNMAAPEGGPRADGPSRVFTDGGLAEFRDPTYGGRQWPFN